MLLAIVLKSKTEQINFVLKLIKMLKIETYLLARDCILKTQNKNINANTLINY